jgi:hypothetical protein
MPSQVMSQQPIAIVPGEVSLPAQPLVSRRAMNKHTHGTQTVCASR